MTPKKPKKPPKPPRGKWAIQMKLTELQDDEKAAEFIRRILRAQAMTRKAQEEKKHDDAA